MSKETLAPSGTEEVSSSFGYLSGYQKPIKITDQIDILRSHWPSLNPDPALRYYREVYPTFQFPNWVEGPFAIIRSGFFSNKYYEELGEVFGALIKSRDGKLYNYRAEQLGPEYLRQSQRTLEKLDVLMEQQPQSDILISSGQFGFHHRGCSIRRAREKFMENEYGIGAKDGGTMLLINPIRLQHYDDLWIDFAGDEFAPLADGDFDRAPCFNFDDDELGFHADWLCYADDHYGSVSAFLPQ